MSPSRARIAVAVVTVVALTAAGGFIVMGDDDDPGTPPATDPPAAAGDPAPSPTLTPTPAPPETPTPSPTPAPDPVEDDTPDLASGSRVVSENAEPVDPDGEVPPDPESAAALEAAAVELDGDALVATLELAGPPPAHTDALLLWSVDLANDEGELLTTISVQQDGGDHVAAAYDWATGEQAPLDPSAVGVDGSDLHVRVPTATLPDLGSIAGWAASAHLDGAWEARVPGEAHDPDAPFEPFAR